ncbi:sugar transferase [Adhaeretor mobilis]|uniref:UDP-glucose:undecaprenyl-phosphate glucose-1-phosphate transferase n=1 Tax=Adhaeretor mobilis TaxID=1930276 RepID=A0A517MY39_9BACT|nr:sugar transferase [Adhaeretor mobilis]QDS99801.1 UDP-glucose:undecaprenyl-phosphate glucose-1-phosphate transferase [Adhaeretor mobilis]
MNSRGWQFGKRAFDLFVVLLGLVVVAPVLIAIALLVKATSQGPVFYRGVRTGRHGKSFRIWKFRSMVADGEQRGGTTTGKNDPRITRVGSFLRKYKLDELPQLFNVLAGEMSFVGPRPEVPEYTEAYTSEEQRILSVRPGITDWSSIEFNDLQQHVGEDDPDRVFREQILSLKNELRLKYVDEQSWGIDLAILAKTATVLAKKPFKRDRAA